jgi:hypothetical protein
MAALLKILQVLRALLVLVYQLQPEEDNFLYKKQYERYQLWMVHTVPT